MVRGLGIEPSGACSSGRCVHQLTHLAVAHPRVELGRGLHQNPQLDRSVVGRRTPVGNRTRRRRRIRPAGATSPPGAQCGTRESNPASSACKAVPFTSSVIPLVGVAGVEPASEASKAPVLPLDDTPVAARRLEPHTAWRMKPADRLGVLRLQGVESNHQSEGYEPKPGTVPPCGLPAWNRTRATAFGERCVHPARRGAGTPAWSRTKTTGFVDRCTESAVTEVERRYGDSNSGFQVESLRSWAC